MSVQLMDLVWKTKLSPGPKLVALALADHADEQGSCWPSIARIAARSGLNERTVFRHLRLLEKNGLVKKEHRAGRSTRYTVTPPAPDKISTLDSKDSTTPVENVTQPVSDLSPRIINESPSEQILAVPPLAVRLKPRSTQLRDLPADFKPSDAVRAWAAEKGYSSDYCRKNLDHFIGVAKAKGYKLFPST